MHPSYLHISGCLNHTALMTCTNRTHNKDDCDDFQCLNYTKVVKYSKEFNIYLGKHTVTERNNMNLQLLIEVSFGQLVNTRFK